MILQRKENWKDILYYYINENQNREYELGVHDCALFASDVILAMTGTDLAEDFRTGYKTKTGYLKIFKRLNVRNLEELANIKLGWSKSVSEAKAGDMVLYIDSDKIEHLGICIGLFVVIPGIEGLHYIYTSRCKLAWSV